MAFDEEWLVGILFALFFLPLACFFAEHFSGESSSNCNFRCHCHCRKAKAREVQKTIEFHAMSISNNNPRSIISSRSTPSLYTLQYFGSDRNQLQKASAGCIIKNSRGEFCAAAACNLENQYPNCHVAIAEAIALWYGLKLARRKNVILGSFQGRNDEVRDRVLDQKESPPKSSELTDIIEKIKSYLSTQAIDVESTLQLVGHGEIEVARALAIEGGLLTQTDIMVYESVQDLPRRVSDLLN